MERHDTHILSDSQDDLDKEEDEHFYIFNNSENSDSNSLKNTINTNSKRGSKFNFNELIKIKNNEAKDIYNDSLVSSKDLEDLFYNENRFTKQSDKTKEKKKEKKKEKEKEKEKENNNISKDIKDNNINKLNKSNEIKNPLNITNLNNKNDYKNESEIKKIPDSIKIKMIKLNYDDNISVFNKYLTYTPYLINKLRIKKVKKKRNCISFENNKTKVKQNLKDSNKKENINKKSITIQKKKLKLPVSSDTNSEKSIIANKSKRSDNKKVRNLYDILKNNDLKLLKISKDSFAIMKTKNLGNSIEDKTKKFAKRVKSSNSLGFQLNNKIQKQNDFYLKQDYEYNVFKKYFFSPGKIQINGKKRFEILQSKNKNNNCNKEYTSKLIISNNNNSQYSVRYHNNSNNDKINKININRYSNEFNNDYEDDYNEYNDDYDNNNYKSLFNNKKYNNNFNDDYISCINRMNQMNKYNTNKNVRRTTGLKLKNDRKIKILYDLYCKRPTKENKNISRINSAFSIKNNSDKYNRYQNSNNLLDLYENFENNDNMIKNRLYNSNNKNWLLKLMKIQKDKNMYHYEKHFGNNESCPLCQQMDKKNEEQIKKIGIYHMASDYKKSDSRSNSKKRRINSALPNFYTKNIINEEYSKENELNNGSRNNLHYNKSTAIFKEYNLSRKYTNKSQLKRKLKLNKQNYMNSNFS